MNNAIPDIRSLVPHRDKALLVREITGFDKELKTLSTKVSVTSESIVGGHFPYPLPKLYRGVDLVECAAISGIALVRMLNPDLPKDSIPFFKKIMETEFFAPVKENDAFVMIVKLERYKLRTFIFSFAAHNQDEKLVVEGRIMGMMVSA